MRGREGLGALGLGVLAVACCAALPLAAGVLGGVAVGVVLGAGAGAAAVVAFVAVVLARRRAP